MHTFGEYESNRYGVFFTTNPAFAALYGEVEKYELLINNTINLDKQIDFSEFIDDLLEKDRNTGLEAREVLHGGKPIWMAFEEDLGKHFVAYLLQQGYDSATFTEYNENDEGEEIESQTIVVLKPNKIVKGGQLQLDI